MLLSCFGSFDEQVCREGAYSIEIPLCSGCCHPWRPRERSVIITLLLSERQCARWHCDGFQVTSRRCPSVSTMGLLHDRYRKAWAGAADPLRSFTVPPQLPKNPTFVAVAGDF